MKHVKAKALDNGASDNSEYVNETLPVACITTDFSMQVISHSRQSFLLTSILHTLKNVLIQLGIPVISVDGLLIRTARSYILKCRVCPG